MAAEIEEVVPLHLQLPEDVLMEILSKLPVKSLLRFRSVCKDWCSLIQNPRFVALHHNRVQNNNRSNDSIFIVRYIDTEDPCPEIQNPYYDIDRKIVFSFLTDQISKPLIDIDVSLSSDGCLSVCGPCNGIVCISNPFDIVLCNPATREFKKLPVPPFSYPRDMHSSCQAVGFGFDPNADDYKVVRIVNVYRHGYYDPGPLKFEMYNLSMDCWREVDCTAPNDVYMSGSSRPDFQLLFNGAFHWYGYHAKAICIEFILAFDMTDEVIRLIEFPDVCSYCDGKQRSLLVLNESLAMILILYMPSGEEYFDIWVMNEYGVKESWTKQFCIGPLLGVALPLAFWKDGELLMDSNGQLVSCDLNTQGIEEFQVHGVSKTLRVLLYTESLTSIKRCIQLGRWDNSLL